MKALLFIFITFSALAGSKTSLNNQIMKELKPCPKSPNCVCSQETKKSKFMEPLSYSGTDADALKKLKSVVETYENATLIEENNAYLHYEFVTKIGKFTDDVEFLLDSEKKLIHFRSASRKGYGDFGKNKRRMKSVQKAWSIFSP